jgi:hypothetical protein
MWLAALIVLVFLPSVQAKPRYFRAATLVSMDGRSGEYRYTFDGPFGIFTVRRKPEGHQPRLSNGEVRIAVERNAVAGIRSIFWTSMAEFTKLSFWRDRLTRHRHQFSDGTFNFALRHASPLAAT